MNIGQEYFYLQEEYDNTDTQENFIFTATIQNGNTSSTATLDVASLSYEADAGRTVDYEIWNTSKADTLVKGKIDISKDSATGQALNVDIQGLEDGTITAKLKANYVTQGSSGWVTTSTITKDSIKPTGYKINTFSYDPSSVTVSFNITDIEKDLQKLTWEITDPAGTKLGPREISKPKPTISISGEKIDTLKQGTYIKLKIIATDAAGNVGDPVTKSILLGTTKTVGGIWSIKMGGVGFIPGQTDEATHNFYWTIGTWSLVVLIMIIYGNWFGGITNTIALYRLSLWNVLITFAILFAGFIGYLYWIGRCSTYDADKMVDRDEDVNGNPFFNLFANKLSLAHLIAGFFIVGLTTVLTAASIISGDFRNHYMLIFVTIVCLLFVGFGFIPVIMKQTDKTQCTQKQELSLSLIVTLCIFFLSSAYIGSIFLVYLFRLVFNQAALPKLTRGWGLVMSLFTIPLNIVWSIFIIIANIFGGLPLFLANKINL